MLLRYTRFMTYEKLNLEGRVAVVIGGTTGIGRALALGFAEAGATLVASSRKADQVEAVARELEQLRFGHAAPDIRRA